MPPEEDDWDFGDELARSIVGGEIPEDFQSIYHSGPFARCIDCDTELLETGEAYSVVKSYVVKEPVFEMAICARCSARLAQSYSAESKAAFESSMREWRDAPPPPTPQSAVTTPETDAGRSTSSEPPAESNADAEPQLELGRVDQLDRCAACHRPRGECRRYSIVGTFLGRALVSPNWTPFRLPLLICDDCNGQMAENISRQTRDSWDRFVEDHFDGPPGIELDSPRLDPILI